MSNPTNRPSSLPSRGPGDANQLGLLLDAAQDMLGEEIRRTDRLEARARHMSTAAGALFAVVMATSAGILNALLDSTNGDLDGWVVPVLCACAGASIVSLSLAIAWTLQVQHYRETSALDPKTFDDYIDWAEKGHVAVAKNLITTYASLLRSRRDGNDERVNELRSATYACGIAVAASLCQLLALFLALLTK